MKEISITIDGKRVACEPGTSLLDAARMGGIRIPSLCHHPDLRPHGACRICLVEDEKSGRIMASCVTPAAPGMSILTASPRVLKHRRNIVRLMISEHPESCIVCGKGNRCELRQIAAQLGIGDPELHPIPNYRPLEEANPFIVRDLSKCILCGKCIRADHELVRVGAIDYNLRGFRSRPATLRNTGLEQSSCTFCGTCVSMCPTGALSIRGGGYVGTPERESPTVCGYCGVGCSLQLGAAGERVVESGPSHLPDTVNGATLCVRGHFALDSLNSPNRLTRPEIVSDGARVPVSWDKALDFLAGRMTEIKKSSGPQSIGFMGSSKCSNEENYLFQKIARAVVGTNNVDNGGLLWGRGALRSVMERMGWPRSAPLDGIEKAGAVLLLGADPTQTAPVLGYRLKQASEHVPLIVVDPRKTDMVFFARHWARVAADTDLDFLNALAATILKRGSHDAPYVNRFTEGFEPFRDRLLKLDIPYALETTGVDPASLEKVADLLARGKVAAVVGQGILAQRNVHEIMNSLLNLLLLTGSAGPEGGGLYAIPRESNQTGAWDMGAVPDALPGRQPLREDAVRRAWERAWGGKISPDQGLNMVRMIEEAEKGTLKALFIMGENPVRALPEQDRVRRALQKLEFLAVQDILETETSSLAHVALPGAAFAEKAGSFTNMEGRIQRFEPVVKPPGDARPDWEILDQWAARMGDWKPYASIEKVRREIARLVPSYAALNEAPAQAWVRAVEGKRISFSLPVESKPLPKEPDLPYTAIFGSVRFHLGCGTRTDQSERVRAFPVEGAIGVSRADAGRLGIRAGEKVRVASALGHIEREVRVDQDLTAGMVYVPTAVHANDAKNLVGLASPDGPWFPGWKSCAVKIEKLER